MVQRFSGDTVSIDVHCLSDWIDCRLVWRNKTLSNQAHRSADEESMELVREYVGRRPKRIAAISRMSWCVNKCTTPHADDTTIGNNRQENANERQSTAIIRRSAKIRARTQIHLFWMFVLAIDSGALSCFIDLKAIDLVGLPLYFICAWHLCTSLHRTTMRGQQKRQQERFTSWHYSRQREHSERDFIHARH